MANRNNTMQGNEEALETLARLEASLRKCGDLLETVRAQQEHLRPNTPLKKAVLHTDLANQHMTDVARFVEHRRRSHSHEQDPFRHLAADLSKRALDGLFRSTEREDVAPREGSARPGTSMLQSLTQNAPPTRTRQGRGFRGYTQVIPLPDLIGFIGLQCQDGLLTVSTNKETVEMVFEEGNLIHMHSKNPPPGTRLGDVLVELGILDQETLNENIGRYRSSHQRLGAALVAGDLVSREDLRRALEHQVSAMFQRLVKSQEASFAYEEGMPEDMDRRYSLSVTQLVLEYARLLDEAAVRPREG